MLVLLLAGCTLTGQESTLRDELAARRDEIAGAQAAALALWDRLIFGEIVSCQDVIPVPEMMSFSAHDLDRHPQAGPIQDELNEAIRAVQESAGLWDAECADSRAQVSLDVARLGREAALAAGDPLAEAESLLAAW